jgi:hypothetical protein
MSRRIDWWLKTRDFGVPMVIEHEALGSWDWRDCQRWLELVDPNGEYSDDDCAEYGTTLRDLRNLVWDLMREPNQCREAGAIVGLFRAFSRLP